MGGIFIKKKYILLSMTILWVVFIFYMSSKPAVQSSAASSKVVDAILSWLNLNISFENTLTILVRKGAHFTEYFILSLLITTTYGLFNNKTYNYSFILLIGVLIALGDEFLQGFILGRSSEVRDVLIDLSGVATFLLGFYNLNRINKQEEAGGV